MKDKFGAKTTIAVGQVGDFEIFLDGALVFSKQQKNRFPDPGEVEKIAGALTGK